MIIISDHIIFDLAIILSLSLYLIICIYLVNVEGVDRPVEPEVEDPAVGGGGEAEVQLAVLALIPGVPGPHAHAGRGSRRC